MQGSISGQPEVYRLSQQHEFKTGLPTHVDSALEALLSSSWLAKHFLLRVRESASMVPDICPSNGAQQVS